MSEQEKKPITAPAESQADDASSAKTAKEYLIEGPETMREIDQLPEPARRIVQMQMALLQTSSRKMPTHPLFEKFTPENIDKFLDNGQKDLDNRFRLQSSNRWFNLVYFTFGLGALLFLIVYLLPQDKELLTEFLKLLVVFASGVGSGYGLKSYQEKKR